MIVSKKVDLPGQELGRLRAFLTDFWGEMQRWEAYCCRLEQDALDGKVTHDQYVATATKACRDLFDRYCFLKKEPTRVRGGTLTYGDPSFYDPNLDSIVFVKKTKTGYEVHVQGGGDFGLLAAFTVVEKDSQLKLLDKRTILDDDPVTSGL